jgi:hypothetical protein
MRTNHTTLLILACAGSLSTLQPVSAAALDPPAAQVRSSNPRIREALAYAVRRSSLFDELITTLNRLDRVVYVEEGRCPHRLQRSCLQLMPTPGGRYLFVRIDSRQPDRAVVAQLAHELYHAVEIARVPGVVDAASFASLYDRIGTRICYQQIDGCWETEAAVDFAASVTRQLSGTLFAASGSR